MHDHALREEPIEGLIDSGVTRLLHAAREKARIEKVQHGVLDAANGSYRLENVSTTVQMRDLSDAQIERYLQLEQPYDCAGSAKAESLGIALTEKITSDDPTALIGLPLITLVSLLQSVGCRLWDEAS